MGCREPLDEDGDEQVPAGSGRRAGWLDQRGRAVNCSACGCPSAYVLLNGLLCWNRSCRNFHADVIDGSNFSKDGKTVNGDSVEELKKFLDPDGDPNPFG